MLIASWYAMQITHELGHVLHAWISGGRVANVELPLIGFSRTDLSSNPHPQFVAWGGPIWGCVFPLALFALTRNRRGFAHQVVQFFAGFCLIANGSYLGVGSFDRVGDAGELLQHGASAKALIAFGTIAVMLGLSIWHRLGLVFRGHRAQGRDSGTAEAPGLERGMRGDKTASSPAAQTYPERGRMYRVRESCVVTCCWWYDTVAILADYSAAADATVDPGTVMTVVSVSSKRPGVVYCELDRIAETAARKRVLPSPWRFGGATAWLSRWFYGRIVDFHVETTQEVLNSCCEPIGLGQPHISVVEA